MITDQDQERLAELGCDYLEAEDGIGLHETDEGCDPSFDLINELSAKIFREMMRFGIKRIEIDGMEFVRHDSANYAEVKRTC